MKRTTLSVLLAGLAATTMFASSATAAGTVMYDFVPDPVPSHLVSAVTFDGGHSEIAQHIIPATTGRLGSVTVTMNSRACQEGLFYSNCVTTPNPDGSLPTFEHPITINLYEVGGQEGGAAPGALIGSVTGRIAVPYRPSGDGCYNGGWYASDTGGCGTDYAFNATFDFTQERILLPAEFVVGVAFQNSDSGLQPGPYDFLAIGTNNNYNTDPAVGAAGVNYLDSPSGLSRLTTRPFDLMVRLETARSGPVTADDCKAGGFAQYGFTNQGQCVSSVNASENAGK